MCFGSIIPIGNNMRFYILLFSFVFSIISSVASAETRVNEYHLPNGLKVLVKEDHRVPVVVTEVWYKVGSSYEPNGITGISHALEHMMFKGTPKYGPGKFSKTVAENGGDENAFTSNDYTAYYQMLEADKLPKALELEADRMRNLSLREDEFTKEIEVVKEERRLRTDDSPQSLTYERFLAAANVASPYHHPVIGWMWDLNNLKITDVRNWYHTWYSPNNAILVIVGDVQPKAALQLAQKYFGPLKSGTLPVSKQPGEINDFGGRRIVVKTPAKLPMLVMGFNTPALKTAKDKSEAYALKVLEAILDGGDSARLPKDIVRGKQLVTDIDVSYDIFSRLDNIFTVTAIPAPNHTPEQVENAILAQIKNLQTTLVDSHELARVKAQVIAGQTYEKDSIMNQANEMGALEAVNLSWREADESIQHVAQVTPEQVQAVARKYLIPQRLTIANLRPLPLKANQLDQPIVTTGGQNVR
jgi:zinc protease